VSLRKPLLDLISKGIAHPDILDSCLDHIADMLQTNALSKFLKAGYAQLKSKSPSQNPAVKTYSLRDVVMNELPSPYTCSGY
jgi:hypothetical protein